MEVDFRCHPSVSGRFISQGRGKHVTRTIKTWELIFVIRDELKMFINEPQNIFHIPAGSCLLLPANTLHGGSSPSSRHLSFYWLHFSPENQESLQYLQSFGCCFQVRNPARLGSYFQLYLSLQEDAAPDIAAQEKIISLILHEAEKRPDGPEAPQDIPAVLLQLRHFISLHYMEDISTSILAEKLNIDPDYLGRLHRKYFKGTISQRINGIRIRRAERLLQETTMPINQIAFESGFNDLAYFRKCFFRINGTTPGKFRKQRLLELLNTQ